VDSWLNYLKHGLSRQLPEDQLKEQSDHPGISTRLGNLRPYLKRHWRKGVLGAILVLISSLLTFPQPLLTRYLVDNVILAQQLDLLLGVILLMGVVKILGMASGALQQFYFARFQQVVILNIQSDLFERTLHFPKTFFDEKETGYLMSRLSSDVQGLSWFFSSSLVYIATSMIRLVGGVVLLFYLEWRLALVSLVVLPGLVLTVRYFSNKLYVLGHHGMEQQAQISRQMQESLSATSLIKAFSSEKSTLERIRTEWQTAIQISMEQTTISALANLAIGAMPDIASGIVLLVGGYLTIIGQWTLGSLLAFLAYLGYVYGPALYLATANMQLQSALASLERISVLFDIVPEENLATSEVIHRLRGEVDFKDVSFAYNPQEPVLKDVSFHVDPGNQIAIVGPSGVGKTTLVSLILRFYKPTQGEILFDGRPAQEYEVKSLRKRIGYVSQSPLLLSGTILENLRYGDPDASEEQVMRATQVAGIHDFITSLPQGYQSLVGERGVNLSEGQKQRLSLARGLIKDPDILVLDEPTSALDSLVEKSIFDALPNFFQGKTLFVVAHRLSTVQNTDCILLLNEMRLVATGTHRELMGNNDYYRSLVTNQQVFIPT
jgi:ABC-type multidrug transport system fused ATPase/permease subunit